MNLHVKKEKKMEDIRKIPLNLQLFADEEAETEVDQTNVDAEKETEKTFTQDEVNKIVQDRLAKEKAKNEKAQEEAKKLAKMNAEQKNQYMVEQLQKELEEYKTKEAKNDMIKEANSMLKDNDITLPDEVVAMLIGDNAEDTKVCVDSFSKAFKTAVERAVNEKLKGKTPKQKSVAGLTREDILSVKDRQERQCLIKENEELFM
ncbi:phage capsid protein [Finegoldia magna]|uniref:Phage capsid protein n=2 Tax=Finegoldia magna TaxID=1260 RepID=A0A2N6SUH2_FINMA|nr:phage capsid protein [Finegoldia magna]